MGLNGIKNILKRVYVLSVERKLESHYETMIHSIRSREQKRINFACYVVYDSTFGGDSIIRMMTEDLGKWNPKIVIVPDILRGKTFAIKTYQKTKEYMISKYGEKMVLDGWDMADKYYDYTDDYDVIYYCNPYDSMVHKYHSIKYAANRNVLPIYITYGYEISSYYSQLKSVSINLVWKYYTSTLYTYQDSQKYGLRRGRNVELMGYSKMDALKARLEDSVSHDRKTILITPHHTINDPKLPLSTFLDYSDLYIELPQLFSDIDFIFRPHPLMFVNLVNQEIWTQDQVDKYIMKLKERGVEYSAGGDYFDLFARADAIINDSGSFTVEWLFTGKPGCFIKNPMLSKKHMTSLMSKALSEYSIANNKEDIISFVKMIEESNIDCSTYQMKEWVKDDVAVNYPNVAGTLLAELERILVK